MILNGRYYLDDPESGRYYEVTKEHYEAYHKRWEEWLSMIALSVDNAKKRTGTILITTTPDDVNSDVDLKEFWK